MEQRREGSMHCGERLKTMPDPAFTVPRKSLIYNLLSVSYSVYSVSRKSLILLNVDLYSVCALILRIKIRPRPLGGTGLLDKQFTSALPRPGAAIESSVAPMERQA